jgi:hypothetical protein
VRKGIHALGQHSDAVLIDGGDVPLEGVQVTTKDGERIRRHRAKTA